MFRDPPLVEIAMATSSGWACAIICRRKITSVPTSLAMAVIFAGSSASETAGTGFQPDGRRNAVDGPIVGVGGRSAISKNDQLAAAADALCNRGSGIADLFRFLVRHLRAQLRVVSHFHSDGIGHLGDHVASRLLLAPKKRIEKSGLADVVTQLAMLEEDVHRLPERVIENLDQFLLDEWIGVRRRNRCKNLRGRGTRTSSHPRARAASRAAQTSGSPSGGPNPITMSSGRTIASSHGRKRIERSSAGKRALADDDGMNELDGNVLRVGRIGPLPKREQAAAAKKAVGHLAACFRQAMRLSREERLKDLVSRQKALFNLRGELALGSHFSFASHSASISRCAAEDRPRAYPRCGCRHKESSPAPSRQAVREFRR